MASPFSIFRRHQRALMIILTGLAMFAFIVMGSLSATTDMNLMMPLIMGGAFSLAFWLWGKQSDQGKYFPVWGFAVGVAVFLIPGMFSSTSGSIETKYGDISPRQLFEMKKNRQTLNQFIAQVFRERPKDNPGNLQNFIFPEGDDRSYVFTYLLQKKADELGVSISDERVAEYINTIAGGELTRSRFVEIRVGLEMGEAQLFDLLREELKANVALRILNPAFVYMPEQYYREYEKANLRYSIDTAAFPVEMFAEYEPLPSDADLKKLFEEGKQRQTLDVATPGFIQPTRARIGWLKVDYATVKQSIEEPTEEELKAKYEEIKDPRFKFEVLEDVDKKTDDAKAPELILPDQKDDSKTDDQKNSTDAGKSDANEATKNDTKTTDSKDENAKSTDANSTGAKKGAKSSDQEAAIDQKGTDKKTDEDASAKSDGAGSSCDENQADAKADGQNKADNSPQKDEKQEDKTKDDGTSKNAKSDDEDGESASENDKKIETETVEEEKKEPKYDFEKFEDVKDQVRDVVVKEKVDKKIEELIEKAVLDINAKRMALREEEADKIAGDVSLSSDERAKKIADLNKKMAPQLAAEAEAIASKSELRYLETVGQVAPSEFTDFDQDRFFEIMLTYDKDRDGDFLDEKDLPQFLRVFIEEIQALESSADDTKTPQDGNDTDETGKDTKDVDAAKNTKANAKTDSGDSQEDDAASDGSKSKNDNSEAANNDSPTDSDATNRDAKDGDPSGCDEQPNAANTKENKGPDKKSSDDQKQPVPTNDKKDGTPELILPDPKKDGDDKKPVEQKGAPELILPENEKKEVGKKEEGNTSAKTDGKQDAVPALEDLPFKPLKKTDDLQAVLYYNFESLDHDNNGEIDEQEYAFIKLIRAIGEKVQREYSDVALARQETGFDQRTMQFTTSVLELVFRDLSPESMLIASDAEGNAGEDRYAVAYWTIDYLDAHVPEFEELGIPRLVGEAYQRIEAHKKAEKRSAEVLKIAEERLLAAKDDDFPGTLATAIDKETLTGEDDSVELSTAPSSFTWLQAGRGMGMFGRPTLQLGTIPGIVGAGVEFRKAVAEMAIDELKVIANQDKSVYYLVQLTNKSRGLRDDVEDFQNEFLAEIGRELSPTARSDMYTSRMMQTANAVNQAWVQRFMSENEVKIPALQTQ